MDLKKLSEFLARARQKAGYETVGEAGERRLPDGRRIIGPYREGNFSYTDVYIGLEKFEGREEISENGKVICFRKYKGDINDSAHNSKEAVQKLYDFLKKALREFPKDKPFKRGPDWFNDDFEFANEEGLPETMDGTYHDYAYFDECDGHMVSFKGKERILYKGKEVYVLTYSGGVK